MIDTDPEEAPVTTLFGTWSVASLRRKAFVRGFASAFDLRGDTRRQYRTPRDPAIADADAIRADFEAVGADLRLAMDLYAAGR